MSDLMIATIIFLVTYAVIISERLHRTTVALAGGALMIAFGVLDQESALAAIDPNTIALLVGMMIIVNVLRQTGIFRFAAWGTAVALGGDPWRMMVGFALFTAVASAFLDNVTTILLIAPVTIALSDDLGLDPRPFLITQVIASNIGGTATLIGDPPNILIGGATGLDFMAFLTNLGPLVLILMPLMIGGFWLVYGRRGRLGTPAPESHHALQEAEVTGHLGDPKLLRISLIVLALTILGFFLHGALHYQAGTIAVFGAVALLLLTRIDPHDVLAEVEWPTIFFFIGLFIVVGGIEATGLMELIAEAVIGVVGSNVALAAIGLLWFAGIASAVVDNIPAVATLIPLTFSMSRLLFPELAGLDDMALAAHPSVTPLWWSLALGACLGGNGSLVGASANVVAVNIAERRGDHIGFWGFTRVGAPFALVSLVVSTIYVWIRYLNG
ncbi:MAG: Na+/H+ antiporter NhaD type [Thermomicrobiales bacterium]|jgi:Na+/H+ antiporter NhaD/arsenite permease-like protein|nr:Na+/H+ antiporter NhaD type [Thermomicrobiales bacterium]MDF3037977.1 Na+/H+ antiporter NhaD type [Thermomicrobiales bacterium]